MKNLTFCLFGLFLTACATLENLQAPTARRYFDLHDYFVVESTRGIGIPYVQGLVPGRYTLFGEDSKGFYYIGSEPYSVMILMSNHAKHFKETNTLPDERGALGGRGGLFIPKDESKKVRLFYEMNSSNVDSTAPYVAGLNAANNAGVSVGGGLIAGGVTSAIMMMIDGKLEYWDEKGIEEIVNIIEIKEF